jgi:hypothetical protein
MHQVAGVTVRFGNLFESHHSSFLREYDENYLARRIAFLAPLTAIDRHCP